MVARLFIKFADPNLFHLKLRLKLIVISENAVNFKAAFEALPGIIALVKADAPYFTILAVTHEYVEAAGLPKSLLINKPYFESYPVNPDDPDFTGRSKLLASFEYVITQNEEHHLPVQRFDTVGQDGGFTERYWKAVNKPVVDNNGQVIYIIHSAEEITEKIKVSKNAAKLRLFEQAHKVFMQAPVAIHIFKGPSLVIELANEPTLQQWGKESDVTGKPLADILPELEEQGYIRLLMQVLESGESYTSYESPVMLVKNGKKNLAYLNFVLQPFYEDDLARPAGVLVFSTDVTERVTIKKELAGKEQSPQLAIEIGGLGVYTVDLNNNTVTYSAQIMHWFGFTKANVLLQDITAMVHPDDRAAVKKVFEDAIAGKADGKHDLVYRVVHPKNGAIRYLRSIGQVQFEAGKANAVSGIIQEVTMQQLSAKKMEESEERFRTMAEGTEILIAVADETGQVTYFNKAWLELTGQPMDVLLNRGWAELVHPEDSPHFLRLYQEAFTKRESFTGEFRILNKEGEYRWLLAKLPVRLRPDGTFAGYISSAVDITSRKQAEEALQQNEAQFRALIAAAPVAIGLFMGRDLVIAMPNQAFIDIVGKGAGIIGKPLAEAMPELSNQPYLKILDDVYTSGKMYQTFGTPVNIVQNGVMKYGFYDFSYTPLFDARSKVYAILDIAVDVTDQVISKRALEESEQNLRNTILQAPVAMCIFKGPGFIVDIANERMLELWGKPADAVIHKSIFEGLPEVRNQGFESILNNVYHTGETFAAHELPVNLPRNGKVETVYVNFVYEAFREKNGTIYGIMAIAVEVTEQVLGRKKVEASEQQVRSLVESAPFPIGVYTGKEMRIQLLNQAIIDTWGKGPDLIGKLYSEVLPELVNQEVYEQLDAVFTTGTPFHAKNQRIDLLMDGKMQIFYFNYSFTPLFDANGNVYGIMNTAADVTDLNLAKQKVEESERNFRNLVMQAPVGICIVSGTPLKAAVVNDSFIEVTGKSRSAFESALFWEVIPEAAGFYEPILENVFKTGVSYRGREHEVMLIRNGIEETIFVNFVFDPVKEEDGSVGKVMILVIEVTQQVLARQKIEEVVEQRTKELAEVNKELQQNNEELGQFAYIASHDLQEPLRKVITFTNMLRTNLGQLDERSATYLDRITVSTKRMSHLIQDVLDFSQLSKGTISFSPVNLNQVMENITGDFELLIEQKGATVSYQSLPTIDAVPLQMQQLFSNLFSNALKFNRPGIPPVVTISSRRLMEKEKHQHLGLLPGTGYWMISVQDNGIGFEQEYAERIFNIFQRLHGKTDYAGTGIGLALCKKIVQNHHGEITAVSVVDKGAVFNIILPEKQAGKMNG